MYSYICHKIFFTLVCRYTMDINIDTPTLNADSTLKEAAEIEWDPSPMQVSMSFTSKVPASPTQKPSRMGGFTFNSQLTLAKFSGLPVKTPSTTTTLSSSLTKWKANNDQNGKVGTAKLKPAIVECVKLINVLHSKATTAGDPELDDDEVAL
jgi:hypothetical protein